MVNLLQNTWLAMLQTQRAIAVIRAPSFELGVQMATAVAKGGMTLIEITWNSDRPADLISHLRDKLPQCQIGAGTLLTRSELRLAIASGAQFLFSPHLNLELVQLAVTERVPVIPGALTPSEIVAAWQAGATCVKVFPVQAVGGVEYIRHLQAALNQIPLIPTGGVTPENAEAFLQAGAIAVGLSGHLFPQQTIAQGDWAAISQQAAQLMQRLRA
ncbi:bifunctional 4-hydroxy-2-oxoglutarate aldolase/2-dehydro-3-deoxy-phosphogluconate aldolase [Phormidium tenue FACHB-886]|nr:bifunctional 4-hydroxy-2-oxoglutarate aldolase/2-dehydro-3-deoxy-phosphogluconate aldolase [Phormidium tenue FACHB-886]